MLAAVPTAPGALREFCVTCGWPLHGGRCDACGGDGVPVSLFDDERPFAVREGGWSHSPAPEKAIEAWHRRDYLRLVAHCVAADGGNSVRTATLSCGPGWTLTIQTTPVFVSIESATSQLTVESPIA